MHNWVEEKTAQVAMSQDILGNEQKDFATCASGIFVYIFLPMAEGKHHHHAPKGAAADNHRVCQVE